ncbi:MAG: ABC transporter permease [Hyphomicrobium sp.]|uniref:cell division protein FtsX n=1 Tax=Hyphomicrobium sp. CS1BSMeth3 TaxID=1892844 RepID=UPI0009FA5CA6|nr:ABC transporter permease [Hyphomicrobium sp. CS1BSMeth3]MBN9259361.1 ABC transporter permease [Hyphomicrobium sp.]MBN9265767.1 ABC transporter permease [Hyphomicrobium sp.]
MSGSYDRPAWSPGRPQASRAYDDVDDYTSPPTGPPHQDDYTQPLELGTPPHEHKASTALPPVDMASIQVNSSIVPAGTVTGTSLTLVVTIMCFLACLTAGAVYMINQSASAWLRNVSSEVTIQIEPRENVDTERVVRDLTVFLAGQPGIRGVRPLSLQSATELIEPWLGKSEVLKELPVPRLIALELDRNAPPDLERLRTGLGEQFKNATLDDHRHWQQQIRAVTRSLALGGIAILVLVGAATMAIIISATRSAMASNREIVEVLHFVGATDRFIAREFETQFLRLGIRAGFVGAVCAMGVFFLMPSITEFMGGGALSMAEFRRLIGSGTLDVLGYLVLVLVVLIIAVLCMFTSRLSVKRILHSQH